MKNEGCLKRELNFDGLDPLGAAVTFIIFPSKSTSTAPKTSKRSPKGIPEVPQRLPRGVQDLSDMRKGRPRDVQESPKTIQKPPRKPKSVPKTCQRTLLCLSCGVLVKNIKIVRSPTRELNFEGLDTPLFDLLRRFPRSIFKFNSVQEASQSIGEVPKWFQIISKPL